jgi:hypothetical protein
VTTLAALLALLALALGALLLRALAQNRDLGARLRAGGRPVLPLLARALLRWSPLGLVILVLAFSANRLGAAAVGLAYRVTALDAYCEVRDIVAPLVIPCTGLARRLMPGVLAPSDFADDVDRMVSDRFRQARLALLERSPAQLRTQSANRAEFYRRLSAQAVLDLERAPEDDAEVVALKDELRHVLRTPPAPAANLLDLLRFRQQRDARTQRLRLLTSRLQARREEVNERAYGGIPRAEQGRRWLRHRISHALALGAARPDADMHVALARLGASPVADEEDARIVRQGALALLAKHEALAASVLRRELARESGAGAVAIALAPARHCAVTGVSAEPVPCLDALVDSEPLRLRPIGFRRSVRRSIDRWHAEAVRDGARRLGALGRGVDAVALDDARMRRAIAASVPARLVLGRADCGWWRPHGCLANAAVDAVEEGADRALATARAESGLPERVRAATTTLDQRIGAELLGLDARLETTRAALQNYAKRFFLVGDLLRLVGWLLLALLVLKSLLYVLSLELFHADERLRVGFADAVPIEGDYRSGRRISIDRSFGEALVTRKQLSNADNAIRFAPWPLSAPLARILRGRYFLFTRGRYLSDAGSVEPTTGAPAAAGAPGMIASAPGGQSIVEWRMQPGEEVVFRYQDFFGASENVELRSELSFRVSTLLLGRIVFRYARCRAGEGRLLLRADVEDVDQRQVRALPPERMIAWSRHAQFTVHSGRGAWQTLWNGYTLVRADRPGGPDGLIVVSSEEAASNLGSIRFLRRIASAIF